LINSKLKKVDYKNPALVLRQEDEVEGLVRWQSPSNIAIVKYWGKYDPQLPKNPSISFTLASARTETSLYYTKKADAQPGIELAFSFEGSAKPAFAQKIGLFLERILDIFPFLEQLTLRIESANTFPHSAGIASSASSMSALALCLCATEQRLFGTLPTEAEFLQKVSYVARLGSGSACRSVYPYAALWGQSEANPLSSDYWAIAFESELAPVFKTFHDDILIVSKKEKSVSSRAGHQLMENNPYAEPRYQSARENTLRLTRALQEGDLETFGLIAESEALTLHALMMASNPPFILLQPNSLSLIEQVRQFRADTGLPLYFTLDAGPNLHLLYPDHIAGPVKEFTETVLQTYCEEGTILRDRVGKGPSSC
jgi:diphosphomevalonate decarboxylase